MYIPSYYKETDFSKLLSFMQRHPFALICSSGAEGLMGTHLPFVVEERDNKVLITGHMSAANTQGRELEAGTDLLLVFQGPHAYVSPSNYEKTLNVPTWNYIAVHAHGKARMITSPSDSIHILEKMIHTFEPAFQKQWEMLPPDYKQNMIRGITSFEIEVTRLEGKLKLSQNKTVQERENIIHTFESAEDNSSRQLAEEMRRRL